MWGRMLLVVVVASLLLSALVMPLMAAPARAGGDVSIQAATRFAAGSDRLVPPAGGFHLNGDCETAGGGCPPPD